MYYKFFYTAILVLLFSCTPPKKASVIGTWRLMDIKKTCNSAIMQSYFGDPVSDAEMPRITYVFVPDSSFKKTTEERKGYWSSDDNLQGRFNTIGDTIQLIVGGVTRETLLINEISEKKLVFIFKNIATSEVRPGEKCDMFHYYEK